MKDEVLDTSPTNIIFHSLNLHTFTYVLVLWKFFTDSAPYGRVRASLKNLNLSPFQFCTYWPFNIVHIWHIVMAYKRVWEILFIIGPYICDVWV